MLISKQKYKVIESEDETFYTQRSSDIPRDFMAVNHKYTSYEVLRITRHAINTIMIFIIIFN